MQNLKGGVGFQRYRSFKESRDSGIQRYRGHKVYRRSNGLRGLRGPEGIGYKRVLGHRRCRESRDSSVLRVQGNSFHWKDIIVVLFYFTCFALFSHLLFSFYIYCSFFTHFFYCSIVLFLHLHFLFPTFL